MIVDRIRREIAGSAVIPKPEATAPFYVKGWGRRRGQAALIYKIPNHSNPSKPHEKGVTEGELNAAYEELLATDTLTRTWFNHALRECAAEGACNFTTIGGLFQLLGIAYYAGRGIYRLHA